MGDVKLTPRQTADLLAKLDEGIRSMTAARQRIITAMAERSTGLPARAPRARTRRPRKPRP